MPVTASQNGQAQVGDGVPVRLGDKTYGLVAQRQGYLKKKLPQVFSALMEDDRDIDAAGLIALFEGRAYALLSVFIPDFVKTFPEWEFAGYPTKEAWEEGEYDETYDKSPTPPQTRYAIESAFRVNGLDFVKHIKNFVSPELIRATITDKLADYLSKTLPSESAPNIPDTPSMTSGTQVPMSNVSEDSPGPGSTDSLSPDPAEESTS